MAEYILKDMVEKAGRAEDFEIASAATSTEEIGNRTYAACDTLQVKDYSKYNMGMFNEEHKKQVREKQFPVDLEEAYKMGVELSRK